MNFPRVCVLFAVLIISGTELFAEDWTRFRGPNGTGVVQGNVPLPDKIGLDKNMQWKTKLPDGISSPIICDGRVFLTTAEDGAKLETVALDANDGRILWHKDAPIVQAAKGERLASATPTTDGKLVISFFESSGLLCYDIEGNLKWSKWFGPIKNQFNHASSPILVDEHVLFVVDHDDDSFIVCLDKLSGKEIWRSYRFVFGRNYASPIIWTVNDQRYLVVAGSGLVTGYELKTGTPLWYCRATSGVVNPTPVAVQSGPLFVHSSSPSSGAKSSPFQSLLRTYDTNKDDMLQLAELPNSFIKTFYSRFDSDANAGITANEYTQFEDISRPFVTGMVAVKPDKLVGAIDNIAWKESRSMPRTPSAIYQDGTLYVVNEGGILHSFDAISGKLIQKGRIGARGTIYSSPALGDGKLYFGTRSGEISVVSAKTNWTNLHTSQLDEDIRASIAISHGRIYIRTNKALYCFGLDSK